MELQQLKYFKAVADIGKIFEAAKSLFVSALYPTTVTTKKPSTVSVEGLCSRYLSSWGSDATAAGGRRKELNEWQRSKFREQMRTETFGRRN
ncbi:MAG: LysR family transcriptional regulator, partial [Oscillospiraceae bacterium]|nr:LysR family transcriptional regulator [Oscillospiraceae bacterium]